MIISKLNGGLGNQMSQYSVGRNLAERNNTNLFLDLTGYERQNASDTPRTYELGIFRIQAKLASAQDIWKLKHRRGSFLERAISLRFPLLSKTLALVGNNYFFEDGSERFDERILKIRGDAYLEGWWHSYRYFDDIRQILLKEFVMKRKLKPKNAALLEEIKNRDSLGIHVRLGDYVSKYKDYFSTQTADYYNKAINLVSRKARVKKIFILVEDPAWPKTNLRTKIRITNMVTGLDREDWEDYLVLLKACKHHIIANSSYSWWAAYLSPNRNKVVVAPKHWLVHQNFRLSDRIPNDWLTI